MIADLERWVMLAGIVAVPVLTLASYAVAHWFFRNDRPEDELERRSG